MARLGRTLSLMLIGFCANSNLIAFLPTYTLVSKKTCCRRGDFELTLNLHHHYHHTEGDTKTSHVDISRVCLLCEKVEDVLMS